MEVRIVITDGVEGPGAAPTETVQYGAGSVAAGPPPSAPAAAPPATANVEEPPADVLRTAEATGALNAGPAPAFLGQGGAGVPPAFVTSAAAMAMGMPTSPGPALPAGAAPGHDAAAETIEAPEPDEED